MTKTIITFSGIIVALLLLFQLSQYSVTMGNWQWEVILGIVALVFLGIGLYFRPKRPQNNPMEGTFQRDLQKIEQLGISTREMEILQKVAEGLSNKEIGETLFVSESTVKTHISNLFLKLDVKRRTQAVQKAKELNLIP